MNKLLASIASLALALPALAADAPAAPAGAPDMTKMGGASRAPKKEDKKGIDELYKAAEEAMKKGDVNASADLVDFPVTMVTDDSKGVESHSEVGRDAWIKMMEPFMKPGAMPKDMKMTHKHSPRFLSETLAFVDEDVTMTMGKQKASWKTESMVVLKDGKWKFKMQAEAGWGDAMKAPPPQAAAPAPAPATPAPAATPAATTTPPQPKK